VLAGLPRWVLPAGAGVVVLLVLLLVLRSCGGGSSSSDAGACLTDLAEHLPADSDLAYGTDFVQAAGAGWTLDGSLEEIGAAMADTGTIPDPVTAEYRMKPLATPDQFAARTGVDPGEVVCSLGTGTRFVLAGSFDPPAVNGSQAGSDGSLTANEDLLGMDVGRGDPKVLLEPADEPLADDEAMMAAVELLRDNGAYSVIVQRGDGENGRALAAGVGAGGDSDDRSVVLAWVYGSDDDAKGGRPEIVSRVNSVLKGTVSITAADLELDGSAVTAVVPSRSAPALQELLRQAIPLVDADE